MGWDFSSMMIILEIFKERRSCAAERSLWGRTRGEPKLRGDGCADYIMCLIGGVTEVP